MTREQLLSAVIAALLVVSIPAGAESLAPPSAGSVHLSNASGTVVTGSETVLQGSGQLVVASVQTLGDVVIVALRGASEAATASLRISRDVSAAASLAVGTVVQVIAESTGYTLLAAGKVIAFVPNEIGRTLLHHSRHE